MSVTHKQELIPFFHVFFEVEIVELVHIGSIEATARSQSAPFDEVGQNCILAETFFMINFAALYRFLFKSFAVGRDVEMVDRLVSEGDEAFLLIKRTWLYGLGAGLLLIPIVGIAVANIYLILQHFEYGTFGTVLVVLLGVTMLGTLYSSIRYIIAYRSSYNGENGILRPRELREYLTENDESFARCFNQLQFNFLFFIVIIGVYTFHIAFVSQFQTGVWAFLDILCILVQLFLLRQFIRLLIDLEMDFSLVTHRKIFFVNQEGIFADISTLDGEKIKTIRSTYPSAISSFFHFGNVEIMTEGEDPLGHILLQYVRDPEATVENISSLMNGRHHVLESVHNYYLEKIL